MTRSRLVLALVAAALVTAVWVLLPAGARRLDAPADPRVISGAIHVHTRRSDGAGTVDDVARAAAAAGLGFVVITDHGDGTRPPDPPQWRHGVLIVDAVELSTTGGHLLALGLPHAPYRLAGEPRDVIEDVQRLGGVGIAAHPGSPKQDLRWREWQAPFQGMEWLNADSEWRDEPRLPLGRALLAYWFRGPAAIVSLFDRPATMLARWDALTRRRRVVAIAGHDAHARVGLGGNWEPGEGERSLRLPSYASAFRAFALRVLLERPPHGAAAGEAAADAAMLLAAIRGGRLFTLMDAVAGPALLTFTATAAGQEFGMGEDVPAGGEIRLHADVRPRPPDARLVLRRNGDPWRTSTGDPVETVAEAGGAAAVYRVEVHLPGAPGTPPVPWIVSNPIYVGFTPRTPSSPGPRPPATWSRPVVPPAAVSPWRLEQHHASEVRVERLEQQPVPAWQVTWRLGGGGRAGQYVALVAPVDGGDLAGIDRLSFTVTAPRPMRLSVQVRVPEGEGLRWQRSVYAGPEPRTVTVFMTEMSPVEAPPGTRLDLSRVDSLLFVVDTVNNAPGNSGSFQISDVRWEGPGELTNDE